MVVTLKGLAWSATARPRKAITPARFIAFASPEREEPRLGRTQIEQPEPAGAGSAELEDGIARQRLNYRGPAGTRECARSAAIEVQQKQRRVAAIGHDCAAPVLGGGKRDRRGNAFG